MKLKWTVVRKYYGFPEYMDVPLYKEEDCFIFDNKREALACINTLFNRGEWMDDMKYGKVRYYEDTFDLEAYQRHEANLLAAEM